MTAFLKIQFDSISEYKKFKWCLLLEACRLYFVYEKTAIDILDDDLKKGRLIEARSFDKDSYEHQSLSTTNGLVLINKSKMLLFNENRNDLSFVYPVENRQANQLHGKTFFIKIITPHFNLYLDAYQQAGIDNKPRRLLSEDERKKAQPSFLFEYDPSKNTETLFIAMLSKEELPFSNYNTTFFKKESFNNKIYRQESKIFGDIRDSQHSSGSSEETMQQINLDDDDKFFIKKRRCTIL